MSEEKQERHASAVLLLIALALHVPAFAQTGGTCVPVSERGTREMGCFITARQLMQDLPKVPLFWHIDAYTSRAAAEAARGPNGTVVESLGKIWLFTITGAGWRPAGGERLAEIGPLPLVEAARHAAVYMEGVFAPGMASEVHRHPGVEAWHTLAGEMCVET